MKKVITKKDNSEFQTVKKQTARQASFPIVGIGTSAGGLEALKLFFENMPEKSGFAFVVIQHLEPTSKSVISELLQRYTSMEVLQVKDYMCVKANHIYVIPPNKSMSILNGFLHLFAPIKAHGFRLPIDYFFNSLADDKLDKSIGVVLSGMGSDGSKGLKAIKDRNGIAVVQDPKSSKFSGMPQSAINMVKVDIIAPADELPKKIISFLRTNKVKLSKVLEGDKNKNNFEKIIFLIRSRTGHDFSHYKTNMLSRRINHRMDVHKITTIENYIPFLQENPNELDSLFEDFLIGVTSFFRDTPVWEKLKKAILPELFKTWPDGYIIRVWVSACSTGQEVYSLAIILKEVFGQLKIKKSFIFQIFATDLDTTAIDKARKGFFSKKELANVSQERINSFFVKEKDGFRVSTSIREMIVFAKHDVIKDPPFTRLDILLCRNLLIYFKKELQTKLMNLFHYSLKEGGLMVLGSAENNNSGNTQFKIIDSKLKIYENLKKTRRNKALSMPDSLNETGKPNESALKFEETFESIQTFTNKLLIDKFTPASILINGEGDILYITGHTGKYLEPAAGKANMNIYKMAREGLSQVIPRAIRESKKTQAPVKLMNLKIFTNNDEQIVNVTLQFIKKPITLKGTIMIVFNDVHDINKENHGKSKPIKKYISSKEEELEIELQRINEELQNSYEETQTMQEELKSTSEEMQSTNEELQSTNEELTTSKEEMQSLNEELQTVNMELQTRVADYIIAENDIKNLLNSTDIATLFLDKKLQIRRFTEELTKLFQLRNSDIGRPFSDLNNKLNYPNLETDAQEVLKTLIFKETTVDSIDGPSGNKWFTVRIMPYRTLDDRIDGLVITFVDITDSKLWESKLNEKIKMLNKKIKTVK